MATALPSLTASYARPLRLRMRPDLVVRRHVYQGAACWVVKEPLGQKFFRFLEEEFAILQMLDGRTSIDEIQARFQRRFAPQQLTYDEIQRFVGTLHRSGLLISEAVGQGHALLRRAGEQKRQSLRSTLANLLAIRFRGVDPRWLLDRLEPRLRWLFAPVAVGCCLTLVLTALLLVVVDLDVLVARLPSFHEFFGPHNWLMLAVVLAATKVLHELGHGLTCRHFGSECHELGVMFLVFTPCLYCNVSDSWMLPSKWQRAAIGAAGMVVELVLASLATFVWWFSEPGLVNHLALQVMFICSVSTMLFNGNPLLRFDGYYILADLVEIPNLRQKASAVLQRTLARLCLGFEMAPDAFFPRRKRWLFAFYAVAAVVYRWLVVAAILLFLNRVLEPYNLKVVGQAVALAAVVGLVIVPLWQLGSFFRIPGRTEQVKRGRLLATFGVLGMLALGIAVIPLPCRVGCAVQLKPRDATPVFAEMLGRLERVYVQAGDRVEKGQVLAALSNIDLELAIAELESQRARHMSELVSLEQQRFRDDKAAGAIPAVKELLAATEEQLREKQNDLKRLEIAAPATGIVLPPPRKAAGGQRPDVLPTWSGSPLEPVNLGAELAEGDLLCRVGSPRQFEAVLLVDQSDIELVRIGQRVTLKLEAYPARRWTSQVNAIASEDLKVTPASLSAKAGGEVASRTDRFGTQRPQSTSYEARAPLSDPTGALRLGMRGRAVIDAPWQSLGHRLWRFLMQTFHFRL